ncbi:MAG: hypothetical protein C9356_16810 [Oleiphilus sp.]|nr:MAG: hypothetical protein C9356_16810 [Oleiphilus sp.]
MKKHSCSALKLLALALTLSACSFVEVKPGAENIILANNDSGCERLGSTTVSVMHEVGFIDRDEETVEEELQILAQNSAYKMGGNAIWPETEVNEGERIFTVLRCKEQ